MVFKEFFAAHKVAFTIIAAVLITAAIAAASVATDRFFSDMSIKDQRKFLKEQKKALKAAKKLEKVSGMLAAKQAIKSTAPAAPAPVAQAQMVANG